MKLATPHRTPTHTPTRKILASAFCAITLAFAATHFVTTPAQAELTAKLKDVAAGNYSLEKNHAHLTIYVGHNGISDYKISITEFDAQLSFDPANVEAASLTLSASPLSVETNYRGNYKATHSKTGFSSWNEDVARSARFLNADKFPKITFKTTKVERTGDDTGKVTGDLTLLGVSKPITFDVKYNGVANPPWFAGRDVIGFNATTTVKRSEFGMMALIPAISDEIRVEFSGEFLQDK